MTPYSGLFTDRRGPVKLVGVVDSNPGAVAGGCCQPSSFGSAARARKSSGAPIPWMLHGQRGKVRATSSGR